MFQGYIKKQRDSDNVKLFYSASKSNICFNPFSLFKFKRSKSFEKVNEKSSYKNMNKGTRKYRNLQKHKLENDNN